MMRSPWPRTIRVADERWKVRLVPAIRIEGNTRRKITTLGLSDPKAKTIFVWQGLKGQARWVVLLHEVLHVAWGRTYGWTGTGLKREEDINKTLTLRVDHGLYEILNRNFGFGPEDAAG